MAIKRKALRQREWIIYIRPYWVDKASRIYYTGIPKVGYTSDMGKTGTDTATPIKGVGEGMEQGSTMEYDEGVWVVWYKTNSFVKAREKYREIIEVAGAEYVRVVEMLPVDMMATPIS